VTTIIEFLIKNIDDDRDRAHVELILRQDDPYYSSDGEMSVYERRFSPERIIADSATKAAIAMMHVGDRTEYPPRFDEFDPVSVKVCVGCGETRDNGRPACKTVRLMASVYCERPDYRDEWRPEE
jgi:hypothetical protein